MEKRTKIMILILISIILIAYTWNYYCGEGEPQGNEITANENFTVQTSDPEIYISKLKDKIGTLKDSVSNVKTKIDIARKVIASVKILLTEKKI